MTSPFDPNRLLKSQDAADFLKVSRTTIYELLRDGTLPSIWLRSSRRIPQSAILDLIKNGLPSSKQGGAE